MNLREQQAEAARALIRRGAFAAFLDHGYVGTTMADIAVRSGVARQTVYNLFESKAALLLAVIEDRVIGADVRSQADDHAAVLGATEPQAMIDGLVAATIGVGERTLDVYRIALEAAVVDTAVADHLERNERDRHDAQAFFVDALASKGFLRADVPVADLKRGFWLLTAPKTMVTAIDAGWSLDQYGAWLRHTVAGLLLRP